MFRVYYKYSACIKICTQDVKILCDPWFGDNAYDGTWTQFPKHKEFIEFIGDFDVIFISHIHPDHYCNETIKALFDHYGDKEIIIADWGPNKPNYLKRKIESDNLDSNLSVLNERNIGDTIINIIPNETGDISDIDSSILVSSKSTKKSVLNINDCIYNEKYFASLNELKEKLNLEITLFCLGYTGAGPYPQTYYSPIKEEKILLEKANNKKDAFFERYKKAINTIKSVKRLPFAGKYLLKGDLSFLNKYRGVADALEVKAFDEDAIILDDSGDSFFDIEKVFTSSEREKFYEYPNKIYSSNDYFWRNCISFFPPQSLLKRLIIKSIQRAHLKSNCITNCVFSIYSYDEPNQLKEILNSKYPYEERNPLITFNCNKLLNPFDVDLVKEIHSHLFIESKALFAVLTGITHWNNYEVGSVYQVRRVPDKYNDKMQSYLNFLSII